MIKTTSTAMSVCVHNDIFLNEDNKIEWINFVNSFPNISNYVQHVQGKHLPEEKRKSPGFQCLSSPVV